MTNPNESAVLLDNLKELDISYGYLALALNMEKSEVLKNINTIKKGKKIDDEFVKKFKKAVDKVRKNGKDKSLIVGKPFPKFQPKHTRKEKITEMLKENKITKRQLALQLGTTIFSISSMLSKSSRYDISDNKFNKFKESIDEIIKSKKE